MILYNVTYGIDKDIEVQWILWMKQVHIPKILSTGHFTGQKFYKVLSHDDEGSSSYCIQYFIPSILHFNKYLEEYGQAHLEAVRDTFKDKHVAFNTLLEEVE